MNNKENILTTKNPYDFSEESIYSVKDIEDLKKHKDTHFVMWYNK